MSIPIEKTLDEVRQDLFGRIATVQQEGWLPGSLNLNRGPIRGMIELWAWGLYLLYQFLKMILGQAFPSTATGLWLDLHASQVDITRLAATKANGTVYFTRTGSTGNVNIASGRIVKTLPDGMGNVFRFVTTEDVVLQDGQTEVAASVEAEEYGFGSNVVAGQITEIVTVIPGVDAVENRSDWLVSEGTDEENDDALRERYVLAWQSVNGVTKYAYESWARSVTGVVAANILDQHPRGEGTVDVVIRGTAGIPTQDLIDAVDAVVQANRPINDDALVKGPGVVDIIIDADLELVSGSASEIVAEVTNRLNALFTDPSPIDGIKPLSIGNDLTMDRLAVVIMAVDGIKKINWNSPTSDTQVDEDKMAVLVSINLTTSIASEP